MALQECTLNLDRTRRELRPHGTLEFPCAAYSSRYPNREHMEIPWHWHEELEVIYVVEGTLQLQVPGQVCHIQKGESIFINSSILHQGVAAPSCEIKSLVFHPNLIAGSNDSVFSQRYLSPLMQFPLLDALHCTEQYHWQQHITQCIIDAFEAVASNPLGYEFTVREKLSRICLILYSQYESDILENQLIPSQDHLRIRCMLDFMHHHYGDNLTLLQIASSVGIGERECLRCFKRMIQISPMQYLLKYRITQSASMLLNQPTDSIAEISSRCGFDSPSNFSQAFKRFFKCTPMAYRKEHL